MIYLKKIKHNFDPGVRLRGLEYATSGCVTIVSNNAQHVIAKVQGNSVYEVQLHWDKKNAPGKKKGRSSQIMTATCECPYFDGGDFCKHIWAVFIKVSDDKDYQSEYELAPPRVDLDAGFVEDVYYDFEGEFSAPKSFSGSRRKPKPVAVLRQSTWQDVFDFVHQKVAEPADHAVQITQANLSPSPTREAWFELEFGVFEKLVLLNFHQRQLSPAGKPGKLKALRIGSISLNEFSDLDCEVLELLTATAPPNQELAGLDSVQLNNRVLPQILGKIALTGRLLKRQNSVELTTEHLVSFDEGERFRPVLRVIPLEKRALEATMYELNGFFVRGSLEEIAFADVDFISNESQILCAGPRIIRFDCGSQAQFQLIEALASKLKNDAVTIPARDLDLFMHTIFELPDLIECDFPPEIEVSRFLGSPVGRVDIQQGTGLNQKHFQASVQFIYDGKHVVSALATKRYFFDKKMRRLIERDHTKERAMMDSLSVVEPKLRFILGRSAAPSAVIEHENLEQTALQLLSLGWDVRLEDQRFSPNKLTSTFKISSGIDWFELSAKSEIDGETIYELPELLKAIENDKGFIRLKNGELAFLNREDLAKLAFLRSLGSVKDDHIKFTKAQGAILSSVFGSDSKVESSAAFLDLHRQLNEFAGIKPSQEMRKFCGTLRDYQQFGLGWLEFLQKFGLGGCLADDMGLGKTIQVLALLQKLYSLGEATRPSLIVAPKSLVFNWLAEAGRFAPELKVFVLDTQSRNELQKNIKKYHIVLLTYNMLRIECETLEKIKFEYAILDEAQNIKNVGSQVAKAAKKLSALHRLALSGTPVENHLGELGSIFEFLNPGLLGSRPAFDSLTREERKGGVQNLNLLRQALRPFILRRTKQEVLKELPPKVEKTIFVEFNDEERQSYDELKAYYRHQLLEKVEDAGLAKSKMNVLEALLRLRQAACHPGLLDKTKLGDFSPKLDALLDTLSEVIASGNRALVFSQFTCLLDIVKKHLVERNIKFLYLDGKTTNRGELVDAFQNRDDHPVFLISLKAGGVGLNLTAAGYCFILDPWWNPAVEAQAIDRAHRFGQTQQVMAYRLITRSTIEEKILDLQASKKQLADSIISENEGLLKSLTLEDLKMLLA